MIKTRVQIARERIAHRERAARTPMTPMPVRDPITGQLIPRGQDSPTPSDEVQGGLNAATSRNF